MKLSPQLFNQLPAIQQDQVLATPNVAEPQNMMNEALTLPEEAQASLANVVQEQAMAWADILRKGRILEEAKVKKRASNLYRPAVAEYARQLDSGELDIDRKHAPGVVGTVPHVGDVKGNIEEWHEDKKQKIAIELGIEDDNSLMASVDEELDSLFITPKAKILAVIQDQYTREAKRMAADYITELAADSANNRRMTDEKVMAYLQGMVEAGVFQDVDTIVLLEEYKATADTSQMGFDAANNTNAFVELMESKAEDGTPAWRKKYPDAKINMIMPLYQKYKAVYEGQKRSEKRKREATLKDLATAQLHQDATRTPVRLIQELTRSQLGREELIIAIQNNKEPKIDFENADTIAALQKKHPHVDVASFSRFLASAYSTLVTESTQKLNARLKGTSDEFDIAETRTYEAMKKNTNSEYAYNNTTSIGGGLQWWNDSRFKDLGPKYDERKKNLNAVFSWYEAKHELLRDIEEGTITEPIIRDRLNNLNPQSKKWENESSIGLQTKRSLYNDVASFINGKYLDPSDNSKTNSDLAAFSMLQAGHKFDPEQPIPVEDMVAQQQKFKGYKKPDTPADYYTNGYRFIPNPIFTAMENALEQAESSESAGVIIDQFHGLFNNYYPDKKWRQIAYREFIARSDDKNITHSLMLFTNKAYDNVGNEISSGNVERTLRATFADISVLEEQLKDKHGESFFNDLTKEDGEIGKVFYSNLGMGNSIQLRNSPTAIEPYRQLITKMAMQLKLEPQNKDMSAEEAAQEADRQLFGSRFFFIEHPTREGQSMFMSHGEFEKGQHTVAEPEDVKNAHLIIQAGIAPELVKSMGELSGAYAKQKVETPLKLKLQGREGYVNRNVNNLIWEILSTTNIKKDALHNNPNIEVLAVPNEDNTGVYYKLMHPESEVWVWLEGINNERWEISNKTVATMAFQTHLQSLYHKMPEYLDHKTWPDELKDLYRGNWLGLGSPKQLGIPVEFDPAKSPIEILEQVAGSPGHFSQTPDLDFEWSWFPMDYRSWNILPDSLWMIGGIERNHLKNEFIPALKAKHGENPTREQILEFSDNYEKKYADLTGKFYMNQIWRFFGVEPIGSENYILPGGLKPGKVYYTQEEEEQLQLEMQKTIKEEPEEIKVHKVKSDETLSSIARKYGTTVDALVDYNKIENENVLGLNQKIKIPPN